MNNLEFPGYKDMMKKDEPYTPKKEVVEKQPKTHAYYMTIILIMGLLGYIGYGAYTDYMVDHDNLMFDSGVEFGVEQILTSIVELGITCEQIPIPVGDKTLNLIAVDCLGEQNG